LAKKQQLFQEKLLFLYLVDTFVAQVNENVLFNNFVLSGT